MTGPEDATAADLLEDALWRVGLVLRESPSLRRVPFWARRDLARAVDRMEAALDRLEPGRAALPARSLRRVLAARAEDGERRRASARNE